jgi:hypothetical protein
VQAELITAAEQTPGPIEQQLLQQVAGIIRRCEDELLSSFEGPDAMAPSLTDRRGSTISNASTNSTRPDATSMPAPSNPHNHHSSEISGQWQHYQNHIQDTPAQPVAPAQVPPSQTPSTDWIDWDAIFPPGCDGQLQGQISNEPFVGFSDSMWTRT